MLKEAPSITNYINCPSYASLFLAIHLKNKGQRVKVTTINNSVKKFCKFVDISYISIPQLIVSLRAPHKIYEFKRKVNSIILDININKNDKFYLLDNSFTIEGFYLAKKFSQRCSVFYQCLEKHIQPYRGILFNLKGLKRIIARIIIKKVLGISLVFKDVNKKPIFGIDEEFLYENSIKRLKPNIDLKRLKLKVINKNYVSLKKYDNLIVDQGLLDTHYVKHDSIIRLYKNLFSYNFDFVIKIHPNFKNTKSLFINYPKYPDYIPVELLFGNIKKNVISVYCTSLITASRFRNIKAISLLELVEYENESYKQKIRKMLSEESDNKIIFVKSFDELKKLL